MTSPPAATVGEEAQFGQDGRPLGTDANAPEVVIGANGGSDLIWLPTARARDWATRIAAFLATQDYTGALFAARGPVPVTVWPDPPLRAPVSVVDTESRALNPVDAARRVSGVARNLARTRFFKKIDSTLRGPIGAELDALLRATSSPGALVCPALPAEHRVVVERVLLVGAQPVAETPIAEDPTFPRAAGTSNVVDLLRPQLDRPFAWIPLGRVREGGSPLAARLVRKGSYLRSSIASGDRASRCWPS